VNWITFIAILVREGLPAAIKLWELFKQGGEPTQADIDALKVFGSKTPRSQMIEALQRAGIDLNSPQAQALLALVPA
jgi:hypothetical protein